MIQPKPVKKNNQDVRANLIVRVTEVVADNAWVERGSIEFTADTFGQHECAFCQWIGSLMPDPVSGFLCSDCGCNARSTQFALQAAQIDQQIERGLITLFPVLAQAFAYDPIEFTRV